MKKRFRRFWAKHARLIMYCVLTIAAGSFLLLYRLGSLTKGFSSQEVTTLQHSLSLRVIFEDPLNLPLTLLQWLTLHISRHHYFLARLPSAVLGVGALICMAYVLQRWYGRRATVLGLLLVAGSSWFLHVSRSATPDILYFCAIPALLAAHLLLRDYPESFWARFVWVVVCCLCLFVPGLVWLVVLNAVLQYSDLNEVLSKPGPVWKVSILIITLLTFCGYLGYAIAREPVLLSNWLGLPGDFHPWKIHLVRLAQSLSYFVIRGPHTPSLWLGRLPILDAVSVLMAVAGLLFYARHFKAPRTQLLLAFFVLGAVLFGLNGAVSFSVLVPLAYVVIVAGIAFLLHTWLKVFPHNPLARGFGIGFVCVALALAITYNLRAYFIAWPKNTDTLHAMQLTPPVRAPEKL